jgi:acetyl-CoA synthetase
MSNKNVSEMNAWKSFLKKQPDATFEEVHAFFNSYFSDDSLPITWTPDQYPISSNLKEWMKKLNMSYSEFYIWTIRNKTSFWEHIIKEIPITFHVPYSSILTDAPHPDAIEWLADARFNIVESCLLAKPNQIAIYYKNEQSQLIETITYKDLNICIQRLATGFKEKGFNSHDRIILYTPFSIDAIACYLALIYIGAEPVLIADSFSSVELKKRMEIIHAKAIITTDTYIYAEKSIDVLSKVLDANPESIILIDSNMQHAEQIRNNKNDCLIHVLYSSSSEITVPYYHSSADNISILFSSGTTKEPKAIPWKATTPIKCASDGKLLQDIHEGDVVSWTSGMGWMMAPWLIFASLLNKASIAIYNGAYSKKAFIDFTIDTKVTVLGTIPSVVKSWKNQGFGKIKNWNIRVFSSTGEPSDQDDYLYLSYMNDFKAPIIEYCGGTEIGGGYISSVVELPNAVSYFNTATPGTEFILVTDQHKPLTDVGSGEVFIIPPAMGLSQTLLNKSHLEEYYSNLPNIPTYPILRKHGDGFHLHKWDNILYYKSIGRTDDTMNLGGIKISAIEIETIINVHAEVYECAAIASQDKNGGPEKLVLIIHPTKPNIESEPLKSDLQKMLQNELNPLFKISSIYFKENLPRTASNKLLRKELRKEFGNI